MKNLIMFNTANDLLKLTGLQDRDELWDNDFNLDDWDIGFCCDEELDEDDGWLLWQMESYCVGYRCTKFNGKYYYMVYHS